MSSIFNRVNNDLRYPILEVSTSEIDQEPLGTKEKFWYKKNGQSFLFKRSREGTGEHWAEKAACELASLLNLPCASYDLAIWEGKQGVVTINFANDCALAHGNELLARLPEYEKVKDKKYNQPLYTLNRVIAFLDKLGNDKSFRSTVNSLNALDIFSGYLLFDAWISNQDRHHENWGCLWTNDSLNQTLAPSYDHAASLGSFETDDSKHERLHTSSPQRGVEAFVRKAQSAFYREKESGRMGTIEAFEVISQKAPFGSVYWRKKLELLTDKNIEDVFRKFGQNVMSDISIDFALEMLRLNKKRILGCGFQ